MAGVTCKRMNLSRLVDTFGKLKLVLLIATAIGSMLVWFYSFPLHGWVAVVWMYVLAIVASIHEALKAVSGENRFLAAIAALAWILGAMFYTAVILGASGN